MEYSCVTATGKEFEVRFMSATVVGVTAVLYIEFIGYSIMELVTVFSNQAETNYIQGCEHGVVKKEYRGYVNLIEAMVLADTTNIRIALTANSETLGM